MSPSLRSAPLAAFLIMFAASPLLYRQSNPDPRSAGELREVNRIRLHFDSVLSELSGQDVTDLSSSQRAQRARVLSTLRGYRDMGVFPHNYDFPREATPYFVDRKTGTLCAVAYLLASTGRTDIVDRVAPADNNVWVAQLAGDTAFGAWLGANGLTITEAARIQVPYYMMEGPAPQPSRTAEYTTAALVGAGAAIGGIWNASANWDGHSRFPRIFGMVSGFLAGGVGLAMASQERPSHGAPVLMGIGALGIGLATHAITHHNGVLKAQREAAERKVAAVQASVTPYLGPDRSAGIMLSVVF